MGPRVCCAVLALLAGVAGGCQTSASGRAIETRLGGSFRRLAQAPGRLFADESVRARSLVSVLNPGRGLHGSKLRRLLSGVEIASARTLAAVRALPHAVDRPGGAVLRRASFDLRSLIGDEQSGLRRRNRLGRLLKEFRASLRRIPQILQIDPAILPGPGDLDRTVDPHQVGRGLTWVERLLRRF